MLRTSLMIDPSLAQRFINSVIAAISASALDAALEFAVNGLTRHQNVARMHFCQGNALLHLNRPADAETPFRRALELDPKMTDARTNLATALRFSGQDEPRSAASRASRVAGAGQPASANQLVHLAAGDRPLRRGGALSCGR